MILADTSVWIDHFHSEDIQIVALLESREILMHPTVIGELACGNLPNRAATLTRLKRLPISLVVSGDEVFSLIEDYQLMGRSIGYIDAHLLATAAMTDSAQLWTLDRRLRDAAVELSVPTHSDTAYPKQRCHSESHLCTEGFVKTVCEGVL